MKVLPISVNNCLECLIFHPDSEDRDGILQGLIKQLDYFDFETGWWCPELGKHLKGRIDEFHSECPLKEKDKS